jgi:outer membrane protein TolC
VEEAILLSLQNNRSLRVAEFNPPIRRTFEEEEEATFDPILSASAQFGRERSQVRARTSAGYIDDTGTDVRAEIGVSKFFPTGTTVGASVSGERSWSDLYTDQYASRVGVSVTQALLQGAGTGVNLASLEQTRLDTQASEYEFRGFAESLVAQVEETYWEYALAQRQIQIFEKSLAVAEQQLAEIEEMIAVGRMAEMEVIAAQAEIASQRQGLIEAQGTMATTRLRLLRLLNPPGPELWGREVRLLYKPALPEVKLDPVQAYVDVALRMRPDVNQAKLAVERGDLEIVKTKNGLLPKLDFFITLGKTGYSDSFGKSAENIKEDYYDVLAGIRFQYPLRNREARARYDRSLLRQDQTVEALENLSQLAELDVRSAYIEVTRSRQQIEASTATRRLQEEKLRVETEKLRVGRSTVFLVSQAQRDLLSSEIVEVRAIVAYLKALVELYRLSGTLLERRGVAAPGREPVELKTPFQP